MGPTCASGSSSFQQQLEAVGLVVESGTVQSAVPIGSCGVQVTPGDVWSGRKERNREVRGQCQGRKRRGEEGGGVGEEQGKGSV